MRTYVVERDSLIGNIRAIRERAGGVPVWAVLKGNGYGLGTVPMARILREQGIGRFCVTEVSEARALREAGFIQEPILMLQPTVDRSTLEQLLDLNVICTVSSRDDAVVLNGIAGEKNTVAEAHVKIDVGMGRYGFLPKELDKILSIYEYMDGIAVSGIYTHFPMAFCSEKKTREQFEQFRYVVDQIAGRGFETGEPHCCNSAAFFRWPDMHMGGVRIGSAFLGRMSARGNFGLRRVGYCTAGIEEIRWLPKGASTGYGGAWRAKKPTRLAAVPVGWYHGFGVEYGRDSFRFRDCFRGALSLLKAWISRKKLYVKIGGQRCPVRGHVGMLHAMVDVSRVDCHAGDPAVLDISPLMQKGMKVEFR